MNNTTTCPPTEELRELIHGSLSSDRQSLCTEHLDSCACCQARLEELATEGTNLSRVVERLHETQPLATSAYWPALQGLAGGVAAETASLPQAKSRTRDVQLTFLQPATDPAYLGRLAQFDVMRILGRGGMGVVLEAFDSRLQRHVAVKVLDPELAEDEVARQRFCREARAAASVTHENVVAVHQVEKSGDNGLPYLVMQLINGETLEQRLAREKKLPINEIVRIGMEAARGLAAAHAQGLIHRDIKPGNILLEPPSGRVKLTDFGLARVVDDVKLTRTGFVSGTPLYMSPEQTMGENADHRSDLFSLGAILYEMAAGQPPFAGNSALAILKQIAEVKHRPLREVAPEAPALLAELVDDLLAKKPADRYQSASDLAEVLEYHWVHQKASSDELPAVCQVEVARRSLRYRIIIASIGAALLAAGLLIGMFFANRGSPSAIPMASVEKSSAEPMAVLSANAGTVWSVAFDPNSDTLAMAVEDGSVRLWDLPTKSIKTTFKAHRGVIWVTRFAPDGSYLATGGDDGLLKLWRMGESEPFRTFPHPNAVRGLTLSHDGQRLYAGDRQGGLHVWSVDSEEPLAQSQQPDAIYAVALSPDGSALATAGSDKAIRLLNAATLQPKLPLEGHAGQVYALAFNRDGSRLASVGWDQTIRIWDAGSGLLQNSWKAHGGDIWTVAYSPDGARLATGGIDGAVRLWNPETGEATATYLGHKIAVHSLAFHPEGKLLASGGRDGAVRVWKLD
jgi:eukaryotic-like serine/threonine-protein kinase